MKNHKKLTLFNLLLLQFVIVTAQNTVKTTFEVNELKTDVDFFFSKLEETHPNLYYYYPKDSISQAKETIMRQLVTPMSRNDFAKLIELNTNRFFDGHTGLKEYFGWRGKEAIIPKSALLFPKKQISVEKGSLYVGEKTKKSKIISINGKNADEIINTMRNLIEAGKPTYIKDCTIEDDFSAFYYLLYGSSKSFDIIAEQNSGKKIQIGLQGVTKNEVYEENNISGVNQIIKNDIALLTINTFDGDYFEEFKTYFDTTFKQIKSANVNHVFIDVSENGGGSDVIVNLLLDYIYPPDYYFLYGYAISLDDKNDTVVESSEWTESSEVETPYLGKVYVLQSYKTFSAAMDFSSAIKTSNRGIIIGEMTGDPAYSFSNATGFTMPNTKMYFPCATGFYAMPSGSHNCKMGILPDVYCHHKDLNVLKQDTNALFKYFKSIIAKYGDRQNAIEILKMFE